MTREEAVDKWMYTLERWHKTIDKLDIIQTRYLALRSRERSMEQIIRAVKAGNSSCQVVKAAISFVWVNR